MLILLVKINVKFLNIINNNYVLGNINLDPPHHHITHCNVLPYLSPNKVRYVTNLWPLSS